MKFLLIAFAITVLPDLYIWSQFIHGQNIWWNILYWIPLALIILSLVMGFWGGVAPTFFLNLFFVLLLTTAIPKLLFAAVSLSGRLVSYIISPAAYIANVVGVAVVALTVCGAIYGLTVGWRKLTVKDMTISSQRIPDSFNGYRIVQLSDLHISTFHLSPQTIDKLVKMVNGLNADAIVFTGDLVNLTPNELDPFMDVLSQFKSKDGVFSVLGNHDYCIYGRYKDASVQAGNLKEVIARQKELGWDLLLNENRILRRGNDSIALVGVENDGTPPFPSYANMPKALKGIEDDTYKVLLSHDPTHWRRDVLPNTNIDLTLAGHTHSMQFRIGDFSPSMWTYNEWGGTYYEDDRVLHVNTGTGGNVPFRFGAWPEITLITLNNK